VTQQIQKKPSDSRDVPNFRYTRNAITHPNIQVGEYTYGTPTVRWLAGDIRLVIGKFCSIGSNVSFMMGGNHRTDFVSTYPFAALKSDWPGATGIMPTSKGDVVVGNDVWFGTGAMVMSGVTIGDGACIGACAVVTKDVPPYTIVAGNPAKPIRKRFEDDVIATLLRMRWWDWPQERIRQHIDVICSDNIQGMMALAKQYP
jgi:acetyltransferase-like isoleucine patch superfamily enzyme